MTSDIITILCAIRDELGENPSERVAVIMAVAMLDRRLEILLRDFFTRTSGATKAECDFLLTKRPCPPLESAGLRVRLARCLNLIDKETTEVLQRIIKCRNDFAHEVTPPVPLASVVDSLLDLLDAFPPRDRELMAEYIKPIKPIPMRFVFICWWLDMRLQR